MANENMPKTSGIAREPASDEFSRLARGLRERSNDKIILSDTEGIWSVINRTGVQKVFETSIKRARDLMKIRNEVRDLLSDTVERMKMNRIILCISELSTNILKHARDGMFEVYVQKGERVLVCASDKGNGIKLDSLEKAIFEIGYYSTDSLVCGMKIIFAYSNKIYIHTEKVGTTIVLEYLL